MQYIIKNTLQGLGKSMHTIDQEKQGKTLFEWYKNCQFGHFLFMGGPSAELHFKKCLFMSIYGLMTKKSYTVFKNLDDHAGMQKYVHNILKTNSRQEFVAPPHFVLS